MSVANHESSHAGHGRDHGAGRGHDHDHGAAAPESAKDPVCGMNVDPATAKHSAEFADRTYYFCCAGCREKFLAEPTRYVGAAPVNPHVSQQIARAYLSIAPSETRSRKKFG